ncbi:hypothetical protein CDL15_Pgr016092 [Punica granatum]|nr:hypothetical protein CDL15_Pgr016092 [Punica granatum]
MVGFAPGWRTQPQGLELLDLYETPQARSRSVRPIDWRAIERYRVFIIGGTPMTMTATEGR